MTGGMAGSNYLRGNADGYKDSIEYENWDQESEESE